LLGGKLITKLELHLLEYKQRELEYLQFFGHRRVSPFQTVSLKAFSSPFDVEGYADDSITDDLVTDLFLEFSERSRQIESEKYVRTLTGVYPIPPTRLMLTPSSIGTCLSIDNTFRVAGKATIVNKEKKRVKLMKGGLQTSLNERGQTITWVHIFLSHVARILRKDDQRFCQSASADEITEMLDGYMRRCKILKHPPPEMVIADNCCHVRKKIVKSIPETHVALDVFHFQKRCVDLLVIRQKYWMICSAMVFGIHHSAVDCPIVPDYFTE
jgi:hypothetical protein